MFRTPITIKPSVSKIKLGDKILTSGSCFSDAIGSRMVENKFQALANPYGTAYNPISIHKALRYSIFNEVVPGHTFVQSQEVFRNYDFHSDLSSLTRQPLEEQIKNVIGSTHHFLKDTKWLLITYGTSWVYERNDTGEIVSNCHKIPGSQFSKSLLSQKKILDDFDQFYKDLEKLNNDLNIILTVSPVRHLKDSIELNSVSKSLLRLTCHTLTEQHEKVTYFPAYEIMMDDLRDYRFYKSDMIHPNNVAEDYIWEKFCECYFDSVAIDFIKEWRGILSALQHRPFHPTSSSHQSFLRETLGKLKNIRRVVDVEKEIRQVESQIIEL